MKRWLVLACITCTPAWAQQADISSTQLISGQADAKLQQLAKEAKSGNKKLVISAPSQWHDLILEQIRKGGGSEVKVEIHDSFAESVMVRSDAAQAAPAPAATPAPAAAPAPKAAPAPAKPAPAPAPAPKAAPATKPAPAPAKAAPAPTPAPAPAPAKAASAPPAPAPAPAPAASAPVPAQLPAPSAAPAPQPAPSAAPAPAPAPAAAAPPASPAATQTSSSAEITAVRQRLEQSLNQGEPAIGTVAPDRLETGDIIYVQGPVRGVVRRGGVKNQLFWLDGDLNLERVELKELGGDRYQVSEPLRGGAPSLRTKAVAGELMFSAADPKNAADERQSMEKRYNSGKVISGVLRPDGVKGRDVLYVGDKLIVVVRLNGLELQRFWLVGDINLARSQLSKEGANKYRALTDLR